MAATAKGETLEQIATVAGCPVHKVRNKDGQFLSVVWIADVPQSDGTVKKLRVTLNYGALTFALAALSDPAAAQQITTARAIGTAIPRTVDGGVDRTAKGILTGKDAEIARLKALLAASGTAIPQTVAPATAPVVSAPVANVWKIGS